jgi:hypothetical protein
MNLKVATILVVLLVFSLSPTSAIQLNDAQASNDPESPLNLHSPILLL